MQIKTPVKIVSKKLGVTTQTVYAWKLGRYIPTTSKIMRLAKLEGVSVEKLLK